MKKRCNYCGGQGKWESSLSVITGEVFYTTCPQCKGTGWVEDETPPVRDLTDKEKRELASKQLEKNIRKSQEIKIVQDLIGSNPGAFKK